MSGKKDATGVSWSTKNADGTIRQDNSKYFKDTSKYEENEHIWYDRNRGQTGYRGANMTDEDKKIIKNLERAGNMKYDLKKLLFSELVYLKINDKENTDKYYKELFERLLFCGFGEKLSTAIIDYEIDIIQKNNYKLDIPFIYQKYFLNEPFKSKFPKPKEEYSAFYSEDGPTKDTLCTSELIFLDDEIGYIITHSDKVNDKKALSEIKKLMPNENEPWLQNEFFTRINFYNWKLFNEPKNKELKDKELIFFRNEHQILFCNKYDYYDKTWKPYTNEYFKIY